MSSKIEASRITEVLACIDGSKYSEAVCDYAAWFSLNLSAPLALLHNLEHTENIASSDLSGAIGLGSRESLLEELATLDGQRNRLLLEQGKSMLEEARNRVIAAGIAAPTLKQRNDGLTESLVAMEQDIRLLVLGVRGEEHAQDDQHLGSHLETSIRALHKPILVVNCQFKTPKNIMLAFDGSAASSKALELLVNSKRFTHLPVHLVTVGESPSSSLALQTDATEKLENAGHSVTAVCLEGDPCETLHSYQDENEIDLTLMGAFSHTRLREWVLGSMTVKMLLSSSRPLLLLR